MIFGQTFTFTQTQTSRVTPCYTSYIRRNTHIDLGSITVSLSPKLEDNGCSTLFDFRRAFFFYTTPHTNKICNDQKLQGPKCVLIHNVDSYHSDHGSHPQLWCGTRPIRLLMPMRPTRCRRMVKPMRPVSQIVPDRSLRQ
jgi:hypothetical protein